MGDRRSIIQIPGFESEEFTVFTGILQRSPISLILFLFFNVRLIEACSRLKRGINAVEFVNDVNILIYENSTESNC